MRCFNANVYDENGNEVFKLDNLVNSHQVIGEEFKSTIRRFEVSEDFLNKVKINDYIELKFKIRDTDLTMEGHIVEINGNIISVELN